MSRALADSQEFRTSYWYDSANYPPRVGDYLLIDADAYRIAHVARDGEEWVLRGLQAGGFEPWRDDPDAVVFDWAWRTRKRPS